MCGAPDECLTAGCEKRYAAEADEEEI